ncbi:MAG: LmbE family N-acetylglucosaminyl deacetylase [Glaciecola sp.]|jgi:LmbE family N-acetylglucosaminyl deacetylase
MPLPKFAVRAAARVKPLVPASLWPTLLATRSLLGDGAILAPAPTGRVLTLSAHPDDDTIGCAGTLALSVLGGAEVTAAMATSGGASIGTALSAAQLMAAREADARRAYNHLGVHDVRFLGLPDGGVEARAADLRLALDRLVAEVNPDVIFVPWALDAHRDHRAVHRALLGIELDPRLQIWSYETWTPLPPNRHVDITPVAATKQAALAEHHTAGQAFDLTALAALSRYRSAHALMGRGEAEGFLVGSPDELRSIVAQVDAG